MHKFVVGDAITVLRTRGIENSIQCVITSPPYFGLRDYGIPEQIGLEATPAAYVESLVTLFREVRRVLRQDGTVWLNLGDSYCTSPRGNKPGDFSTSSLTNPKRQDEIARGRRETEGSSDGGTGRHPRADRRGRQIGNGFKPKDLLGIPWRVALALQADGWYLRSDIIWSKPNPLPESVTDRPTRSHEYLFLLTKSERYYYDYKAVMEDAIGADRRRADQFGGKKYNGKNEISGDRRKVGFNERWDARAVGKHGDQSIFVNATKRNRRSVWTITPVPYKGAHFATFPPALVEPCLLAGTKVGDWVLDPCMGSGTVGLVAQQHGRHFLGIDLNPNYHTLAEQRLTAGKVDAHPS